MFLPEKKKTGAVIFSFSANVCVKKTDISRILYHLQKRRNRAIIPAMDRKAK